MVFSGKRGIYHKVVLTCGSMNWLKHLAVHLMQPNVPSLNWELKIRTTEKGAGELIAHIIEAELDFEDVMIKSPDVPNGVVMVPYSEGLREALALQSFDAAS